ncbi:hypothetical protein SsS58_01034 [Streptomyces scabiei]|uniref:Uncharacterized protein n=1 Tax=Streptomyces scabiei TaxID=1930 RepID=A0A100JJH6_STRSC|nr:hypothetical protein SsS58_01034 [Streptomyces scabiei]
MGAAYPPKDDIHASGTKWREIPGAAFQMIRLIRLIR